MTRETFEALPKSEWPVRIEVRDERTTRLAAMLDEEQSPSDLMNAVIKSAVTALRTLSRQRVVAVYDEGMDGRGAEGYRRACVVIGLGQPKLFHQLFNGPAGYRAMYRRGCEIGEAFNESLVGRLVPAILEDRSAGLSEVLAGLRASERLRASLTHSHAKV